MATTLKRLEMFIGGQWQPAASEEMQEVLNPATGEVIAEVPKGTEEDVERAVRAAADALVDWLDTTPAERSTMLLKLADRIEQHQDELARIESENVGKPMPVAKFDLEFTIDNVRFFAGAVRNLEGKPAGEYIRGYTSMLRREPVGVVASIAPWNYPIMMAIWKIGPALAAGNTVILKPSEWTPLSALRLAELAADIFPAGALNVITGDGVPVGSGLVKHPLVNMVSLTGDPGTGKEVARAAADTLKRVHLELGGKAPVIVFDDADLDAVSEAVKLAGYFNSGQDCTAACRILVRDSTYDNLLSSLIPAVESINVGNPSTGDEEALTWANDVPYGLSASVWTTNVKRALNASRKLRFGTVWINDHIPLVSEMPHGGFHGSGYGKDMSAYSIEEYTTIKHVMAKID